MSWAERINQACTNNDWRPLIDAVPFARFLDLRIDVKGEEFTCILPFQEKLIGNPILPALHGGATGGFLECAGIFYLLWHMDSQELPKTIDFSIDYLRSGRPKDTYANVFMVKQGQRVANLRIQAWQESPDKPIALGHGNFMLRG
ncbi:MAG: PaaI family thioesterase [Burkholderiaceae bacterium]|jgi:Uncharacterized protein, possibly involved in aromatic compounds catabolism|nr:PaaI family thioesterase [Burkholderiaceae bacterium]